MFDVLQTDINKDFLAEAFKELDGKKALGVDNMSKAEYNKNLKALTFRGQRGAYSLNPKREVFIPKTNGSQRPIAIAYFEDKLVDRVVSKILTTTPLVKGSTAHKSGIYMEPMNI